MDQDERLWGYQVVGENRYREVIGFCFDDFRPGDVFEHRPGRTLSESDNLWMAGFSMNPSPLHIDAEYCAHTPWKRPLMSSLATFSIVCGMSVRSTSGRALANLGWDKVRLTHPVFAGDTIYAESHILAKRLSQTRPDTGIVSCETRGVLSTGDVFLTFERSFLVPVLGHETERSAGY